MEVLYLLDDTKAQTAGLHDPGDRHKVFTRLHERETRAQCSERVAERNSRVLRLHVEEVVSVGRNDVHMRTCPMNFDKLRPGQLRPLVCSCA